MQQLLSALVSSIRTRPRDFTILLIFCIAIAILLRLHSETQLDDNWGQFIIDHHCQKIDNEGSNNHRTNWVCDDGEEYFRWRQQV